MPALCIFAAMSLWIVAFIFLFSGILLLRFAGKLLVKLIGLVLLLPSILLVMYLMKWGPFKTNLFGREYLQNEFCIENNEKDSSICTCIVKPYLQFIEEKLNVEERKEIEESHVESAYLFHRYQLQRSNVCALTEEESQALMTQFYTTLSPFGWLSTYIVGWDLSLPEISLSADNKRKIDEKFE